MAIVVLVGGVSIGVLGIGLFGALFGDMVARKPCSLGLSKGKCNTIENTLVFSYIFISAFDFWGIYITL